MVAYAIRKDKKKLLISILVAGQIIRLAPSQTH